jgi:hypothetical protein
MNTAEREKRIGELLQALARGGDSDRLIEQISNEIKELRESQKRDREYRRLTQAPHQPRFRTYDPY